MSQIGFSFPSGSGSGATPDLAAVTLAGNSTPTGIIVDSNNVRAVNSLTPAIKTAFLEGGVNPDIAYTGIEGADGGVTARWQMVADTAAATPVVSMEAMYDAFKARFTINTDTPVLFNSVFNFRQAVANTFRDVAFFDELRPEAVRSVNVNFTVLVTDYTILVDASAATITGTLPTSASLAGYIFAIKLVGKTGAFVCNLNAAALIDGAAAYTINLLNGGAFIQYTGTTWKVLATKN